jgi:3-deoxy-7-phosphoheptulonate synthase
MVSPFPLMTHSERTSEWHPASWRDKAAQQLPSYADEGALQAALDRVAALPPLVTSWEVKRLKQELGRAARGERFLLQGGECAERFSECTADIITSRLKIMLQMSLILTYGLNTQVVRVGRFAGQYAKPRSSDTEIRNGTALPSYRGDIVNGSEFDPATREPDPSRLVRAYLSSAATLNLVRGLSEGGFADLHHPEYWNLDFMQHSPLAEEYHAIADAIEDTLGFLDVLADRPLPNLQRAKFYTSHEALHLPYEEALTRSVPHQTGIFNLGTHLPWIGKRTNQLSGAHVEYVRGIANPLGLKVGPNMTPARLMQLIGALDPDDEPGRLTLITRFGADQVGDVLPPLIEAVQASGRTVLWCADPMHGNTERTASGRKTRRFANILSELEQVFDIHAKLGSRLGGVHFEMTGENVTECIGGARGINEQDLERAYKSEVDPRLNYEQSLEVAFCIVRKYRMMNGR